MTIAVVGLGANQPSAAGPPDVTILRALDALSGVQGVFVSKVSSTWRTEPQGVSDQPWFVNRVALLECGLAVTPESLLAELLRIESELGRIREQGSRFGPRAMDLDLLVFGDERRETPELILPHPRMLERAFVLVPLAEIAPGLTLTDGSGARRTAAEWLAKIPHRIDGGLIYQG